MVPDGQSSILDIGLPIGHTSTLVGRKQLTKAQLNAQAAELRTLRGDRTYAEWSRLLGTPLRSYYRYEGGIRAAPGPLMQLARIKGKKRA